MNGLSGVYSFVGQLQLLYYHIVFYSLPRHSRSDSLICHILNGCISLDHKCCQHQGLNLKTNLVSWPTMVMSHGQSNEELVIATTS